MKRIILTITLLIGIAQLSIVNWNLSIGTCAQAQLPYSYAPLTVTDEELSGLGFGNKNGFVQGLTLFDPSADPAIGRMQGRKIVGVRCYMRADYAQARQKRSGILACEGSPENLVRQTYADLQQGWNDVMFDEPIVVSTQPIYLGVQAYETVGAPYPLVAYAKACVPQSCIVNLGKAKWEEYTDRGTLLIAALIEDAASDALGLMAYAQNTTHPQTVAPDHDFTGGLYLHNFSSEPINSVEIAMQGEGAKEPTLRTITLSNPIGGYGSQVITTSLRAGATEGTSVDWTATVTRINGKEAMSARPGTTKLYVTLDNFQRTPLIEEFTSQRCVNCPQMAYFLDKALEEYGDNYIYISHHSGFLEDVFTTQPDREVLYFFGGYENEYNPAIMYNRAILEGESAVIQGIRDMSAEPYLTALQLASTMPAMAEVVIEETSQQVTVSGRVARDLVGQPLYLSCYLVEDGISVDHYFQKGMDDADAPSDLKEVFRHNGVILHYFTQDAIGDLLSTDSEGKYSVTYDIPAKEGFGGTGRRIVAFVHKVNKSKIADNQVLNAAQSSLGTDGIVSIDNGQRRKDNEVGSVYDLSGRKVITHHSPLASRQSARLPRGIYFRNGKKVVVR